MKIIEEHAQYLTNDLKFPTESCHWVTIFMLASPDVCAAECLLFYWSYAGRGARPRRRCSLEWCWVKCARSGISARGSDLRVEGKCERGILGMYMLCTCQVCSCQICKVWELEHTCQGWFVRNQINWLLFIAIFERYRNLKANLCPSCQVIHMIII